MLNCTKSQFAKKTIIAIALASGAAVAAAAPDARQAESFLRDLDNLVSQGQLQIETMPKRRQHQAKVDELERRAHRLFGAPESSPLGACVQAAGYLASTWTTQMILAGSSGTPHAVAGLAYESMMAGQTREECRQAIEEIGSAKRNKPKL